MARSLAARECSITRDAFTAAILMKVLSIVKWKKPAGRRFSRAYYDFEILFLFAGDAAIWHIQHRLQCTARRLDWPSILYDISCLTSAHRRGAEHYTRAPPQDFSMMRSAARHASRRTRRVSAPLDTHGHTALSRAKYIRFSFSPRHWLNVSPHEAAVKFRAYGVATMESNNIGVRHRCMSI